MSIRFDTIAARFRAPQSHGPELATYESRHQAEMAHGRPQTRVSRGPAAVMTYRARCSGRDKATRKPSPGSVLQASPRIPFVLAQMAGALADMVLTRWLLKEGLWFDVSRRTVDSGSERV